MDEITTNLIGSIPYIILTTLTLIAHFWASKRRPSREKELVVFIILGALFLLIEIIRYGIGSDYMIPYNSDIETMYLNSSNPRMEFLFLTLNRFVIFARGDIIFMMALCAAFIIPAFWIFIKQNIPRRYWFFAIFLFIGTTIFYATMNAVRQYTAIAVLLIGYQFLRDSKYLRYVLVNIIAVLFHTSAIVNLLLIPLVLIYKKIKSKKLFLVLTLSVYAISLVCIVFDLRHLVELIAPILPDRYEFYITKSSFTTKNPLALFRLIAPNILFIFSTIYYSKLAKFNKNYKIWYCAFLIYIFLSNAFYGINVFIRLTWYFDIYLIPLITWLLCYLKLHDKIFHIFKLKVKLSSLVTVSIIAYLISMNVITVFLRNNHGVVPYKTIFEKPA